MSALVTAPEILEAETFERQMSVGKHGAFLVGARGEGASEQCVVKIDARLLMPPREHLLEWIAAVVAERLGVRVPGSFAVRIVPAFADTIADPVLAAQARCSLGTVYGSRFLGPGYTQWPTDRALPVDLRDAAAELVAFDVLIHNFDRRRGNPNLFAGRDSIVAFDHGDAFAFLLPILVPGPEPAVDPLVALRDLHVFGRSFGPRSGMSLERFREAIDNLTESFFEHMKQVAPGAWQTGPAAGILTRVVDVLRGRREEVDVWLPEVESWMRR